VAELALAPWARQLQSKIVTFVAVLPKELRQIKSSLLLIVFLQQSIAFDRQKVATNTQLTVTLAVLTLAPWARQLQSKMITFVAARPRSQGKLSCCHCQLCFCSNLLHWYSQKVATKTQSTVTLAELALAPWAGQLQSKIITFVAALPNEPRQLQQLCLSIVLLWQPFALEVANLAEKIINSDVGWTCLASLGRATTKESKYICYCTPQKANASSDTVTVDYVFAATFC
jgi:hypothetical protein